MKELGVALVGLLLTSVTASTTEGKERAKEKGFRTKPSLASQYFPRDEVEVQTRVTADGTVVTVKKLRPRGFRNWKLIKYRGGTVYWVPLQAHQAKDRQAPSAGRSSKASKSEI